MNIKPEDKTIKAILSEGRTYDIPRFQREYSWEKKNIDVFLSDKLSFTRSKIKKLCDEDCISVNGKIIKANKIIKLGDLIEVILPDIKNVRL